MRRRLKLAGGMLAAVSALLAGCSSSPPEPSTTASTSPTSSPTQSDEQVLADAVETFDRFYAAVDAQFAAGEASAQALTEHATPSFAEEFAEEIRSFLDDGQTSRGVLVVTNSELVSRTEDRVDMRLCTDASDIETLDADGNVQPPGALVAWNSRLVRDADGRLYLDSLDPAQDQGICDG